jgi:vanillate O-demethylase ferredoxin subunit
MTARVDVRLRLRLRLRLRSITELAPGIHRFEWVDADRGELPPFTAGGHVDLHLPGGLVRQYSLVNDAGERGRYVLAVKREAAGRGGSRALFDDVRVGDVLEASAPRNTFPLIEGAPSTVLVAGGIGVTPIVCMAARLRTIGAAHAVHYAVRARDELAFEIPGARVHVDAEAGSVLDVASIVAAAPGTSHLYCCGPPPMLAAFEAACRAWPGPAANVHIESFAPAPSAGEGGGDGADAAGPEFVVELTRSGRRVDVPAGVSILDALRAAGVDVPSSCEQGICGTCETAVIAGRPDHRDRLLSDREKAGGATMLICCSRSLDPVLALDL